MAELKTIANMLKEIRAAYPNWKADEDTIKVWTVYLADIQDDLLVASVRKFISSSGHAFPPSIPEIRAMSTELRLEVVGVPSAFEAWSEVLKAKRPSKSFQYCDVSVNKNGWLMADDPDYVWSHPIVEKCARRFGWPKFPSNEVEGVDRAHFIKAYELMVTEEAKRETRLPQVTEYIQRSRKDLLLEDRKSAFDTGERKQIDRQLMAVVRSMT